MTVPSETNRSGPYNGNGSTTVFDYEFRIVDEDHLRVIRTSALGVEETLTIDVDYIVSDVGDPAGGQIACTVAPATGETITVLRDIPFVQETDLENQGAYYAETVEDALDLAAMRDQQLDEELARSVKIPASYGGDADLNLPTPESLKFIAWNEAGDGLRNADGSELASVVAYGTARADIFDGDGVTAEFELSASPAVLNNLDVSVGGVTQLPGSDYTWTSGTTLTFSTAPADGVKILVRYMQALSVGEVLLDDVLGLPEELAEKQDVATLPAAVRTLVETLEFSLDDMNDAETMAAIINRTGLTPQMCGAQAGDSDHSPFIQAAYARLRAAGGGNLWLPPIAGDWQIGTGITCYDASLDQCVAIRGVGTFTRLEYLPATGNPFKVGSGSADVSKVAIRDIYLYSSATRTAGYDFDIKRASQCSFENIITDGSLSGFNAEYVNALSIKGVKVNSLLDGGTAYRFYADPATGRSDEISLVDVTCQGRNLGIQGISVYGAVNVIRGERVYMLGVDRGLDVDSDGSGTIPFNIRLTQFEVDRALSNAVVLTKAKDITLEQPDIANTSGAAAEPPGAAQGSADGAAFVATSGVSMLRVLNGRIGNARQQAMDLQGTDILVAGNRIHDMSKAGASVAAAIYLASTARRINVRDNRFEGFSRASYAIQAENAVTGAIRDNNYTGMVSGFSAYGGSSISFDNNDSF